MESLNKVSSATKYLHYAVYYQVLMIEAMDLFLKKSTLLEETKKRISKWTVSVMKLLVMHGMDR